MKSNLCDEDHLVGVLRWRRPRLVASMGMGVVGALLFALISPVLGLGSAVGFVFCMSVAMIYAMRLRRLERRLEELEP